MDSKIHQAKVRSIFDQTAPHYDGMNDLMSGGLHRKWKDDFVKSIYFRTHDSILDGACGSGDILARIYRHFNYLNLDMMGSDPCPAMLQKAKDRSELIHTKWISCHAEDIPLPSETISVYTMSFGLRNTSNRDRVLREAYRILMPGGQFCVLEFFKPPVSFGGTLWTGYQKILPMLGSLVGNRASYHYLVESINNFITFLAFKTEVKNYGFDIIEHKTYFPNLASFIILRRRD